VRRFELGILGSVGVRTVTATGLYLAVRHLGIKLRDRTNSGDELSFDGRYWRGVTAAGSRCWVLEVAS